MSSGYGQDTPGNTSVVMYSLCDWRKARRSQHSEMKSTCLGPIPRVSDTSIDIIWWLGFHHFRRQGRRSPLSGLGVRNSQLEGIFLFKTIWATRILLFKLLFANRWPGQSVDLDSLGLVGSECWDSEFLFSSQSPGRCRGCWSAAFELHCKWLSCIRAVSVGP